MIGVISFFSSMAGCDCDVVCDDGCDVTTAQGPRDRDIIIIPDIMMENIETQGALVVEENLSGWI